MVALPSSTEPLGGATARESGTTAGSWLDVDGKEPRGAVLSRASLLLATPLRAITTLLLIFFGCVGAMVAFTRPVHNPTAQGTPAMAYGEFHSMAAVPTDRPVLTAFAAASTTEALTELAAQFTRESGVRVRLNFASSSTLARQIAAGAPADLFLSANPRWMDFLAKQHQIVTDSRFDLLSNRLVLIAPKGEGFAASIDPRFNLAAAFEGRLALGDPEHVPAGIYARQALEHLGWYETLKPRIAPCACVRTALAMVELGEMRAGVVYATDAAASTKVELLGTFPEETHQPIRYPIARCRDAAAKAEADAFIAFLQTPRAATIFTRYGFTLPGAMKSPSPPTPRLESRASQ